MIANFYFDGVSNLKCASRPSLPFPLLHSAWPSPGCSPQWNKENSNPRSPRPKRPRRRTPLSRSHLPIRCREIPKLSILGKQLYFNWCVQCHGVKADGDSPRFGKYAGNLTKFWRGYTEFVMSSRTAARESRCRPGRNLWMTIPSTSWAPTWKRWLWKERTGNEPNQEVVLSGGSAGRHRSGCAGAGGRDVHHAEGEHLRVYLASGLRRRDGARPRAQQPGHPRAAEEGTEREASNACSSTPKWQTTSWRPSPSCCSETEPRCKCSSSSRFARESSFCIGLINRYVLVGWTDESNLEAKTVL